MATFTLTVSTPDGTAFSGETDALFLRGTDGDLAVLPGHMPMITAVQPGTVRIQLPDGTDRTAVIAGGILSVSNSGTTLLSGSIIFD